MPDFFDEILHELEVPLRLGDILKDVDGDRYFNDLQRFFPVNMGRIAWDAVVGHRYMRLPRPKGGDSSEVYHVKIKPMLINFFNNEANLGTVVENQVVIWIGDSSSFALAMSLSSLRKYSNVLFSYPQHSYVFPITYEWCVNYTMEGEIYYGQRPS